ncbi:MAG: EAL domain-containing protein [Thermoguttaceae bacterium]|jgi:EAL domain-containing protein (putative c-di-GMP-specific phosphodiesterase class I)
MPANLKASASTVWFLVGPLDSAETTRYQPIYTVPFLVGRRQDLALSLSSKAVSSLHAEITQTGDALVLRDLDSTNGTYVNGQRVSGLVTLHEDDLVQFANLAFRVRQQAARNSCHTVYENVCDRALALVQFDKLMAERAVTPFFQPIVSMATREITSYEILGRSRLFGLEMPNDMFRIAAQLHLEVELSAMLRWEGVQAGQALAGTPHLFMNTHPLELAKPGLLPSLENLRENWTEQRLTLEIHESAVTDPAQMIEIRRALTALNIGMAYDDFGAGQSRLNELAESPPDYLKFDMSLIRDIDAGPPQREEFLATLVRMVHSLGILSVAEGVETQAESDTCLQMGFDLGQGFLYGRPAPARDSRRPA